MRERRPAIGCPTPRPRRALPFLKRLRDPDFRAAFLGPLGSSASIDQQDGIRIELNGGRTIHFRASGNAPELRCYAEAKTAHEAQDLVRWGLASAATAMRANA